MKCEFCNKEATGTLYVLYHNKTSQIVKKRVLEYFFTCHDCAESFKESFMCMGRDTGFLKGIYESNKQIENIVNEDKK